MISISAVNKTNIVVLLKEKPAAPLTKDAFKVEGATLLDVKPGTFSDNKFPYELMIESLDGKKGTVKVNGISMDYDFTAEAKAKVESVTFDNYRQFRVTFSEEVDPATATDPANYYFEIVEGKAGKNLGAALGQDNKLSQLPGAAAWFAWTSPAQEKRHNITAENTGGKTVVTINLPESARFAGPNPLKVLVHHSGEVKLEVAQDSSKKVTVVAPEAVSLYEGYQLGTAINGAADKIEVNHNTKVITITADNATIDDVSGLSVPEANVTGNDPVTGKKESRFKFMGTVNKDEAAAPGTVTELVGQKNGEDKTLVKDTELMVAVRNVKDKDQMRKVDTAVFPIVLKDEKAPQAVKGVRFTKLNLKGAEDFELGAATTVEVPILGAHNDTNTKLQIVFNEPVAESGKLYVNGVDAGALTNKLTFELADGTTDSEYGEATRATLVLSKAIEAADFLPEKVHNIKIVGIRDLADNVSVPSTVEFNVKLVGSLAPEAKKPELIGAVQVADNIIELEWNRSGAKPKDANQVRILNLDGTDEVSAANVKFASISGFPGVLGAGESEESDLENRPGRYFSYLLVNATDDPATEGPTALDYQGQEFILRKLEVKALTAGGTDNDTFNKVMDIKLVKDISAPVFKEAAINSLTTPPTNYQEVKEGGETLLVKMEEIVPYQKGTKGTAYPIHVMKANGSGVAEDTDKPKELRVSYEKDGITRTAVVQPASGWTNAVIVGGVLKNDVLPIDLSGIKELLDDENHLVEGATYTIEFPAGYFADSKKVVTGAAPADQEYSDVKRTGSYGFLSLAFTVKLTVPGATEVSSDLVPQTSKALINVIPQPSVNREEIEIEFTGSIDPETIKDPSNYTLNGQTLAAWGTTSADIKYVVDGPNEVTARKFARFYTPAGSVDVTGDVEITVQNIANKLGAKMTPVVHKLPLRDNKAPKVLMAKLQGSKEITLTFDEKLAALNESAAGKNFLVTVGGKSVGVVKAKKQGDRVLILELADDVTEGSSIELKVVKDQNGDIHVTDAGDSSGNYRNALPEGTVINVQ